MKKAMTTKTININSIYYGMKEAIERRIRLQKKQDELWRTIKRTNSNHSAEMGNITKKIGEETHQINGYISSLCQYKKTHSAMKLANDYLSNEIRRINKIIDSNSNLVSRVKRGYTNLISSKGYTHSDTKNLENYVILKQNQVAKLKKWKEHVSRYL